MFRYKYSECPVCKETFTEDDDIVVCPECGTPHHRECYRENGKCGNVEFHSPDFTYKDKQAEILERLQADENIKISRLPETEIDKITESDDYADAAAKIDGEGKDIEMMFFPKEEDKDKPVFDGVCSREIEWYMGKRQAYFMYLFAKMNYTKKKVSLNIFAALLVPYYQFFRRSDISGIIFGVIGFLLEMPTTLISMVNLGFFNLTQTQTELLQQVSVPVMYAYVAFRIITALFWNYFYMQGVISGIKSVRKKCGDSVTPEKYHAALAVKGTPKLSLGLVKGIVMILTLNIMFLGALLIFVK